MKDGESWTIANTAFSYDNLWDALDKAWKRLAPYRSTKESVGIFGDGVMTQDNYDSRKCQIRPQDYTILNFCGEIHLKCDRTQTCYNSSMNIQMSF